MTQHIQTPVQLPGVPNHLKPVAHMIPKRGEWFLDAFGRVVCSDGNHSVCFLIVTPDNGYDACRLEDVPVPQGYEYDGTRQDEWFRVPKEGEYFIGHCGYHAETAVRGCSSLIYHYPRIIIHPIKPPIKRVLIGEWDIVERSVGIGAHDLLDNQVSAGTAENLSSKKPNWHIEDRPVTD